MITRNARIIITYPEAILSTDTYVQLKVEGADGFTTGMGTTFYKIRISGVDYTININDSTDINYLNIPVSSLTWNSSGYYTVDYQMLYWTGCNSGSSYYVSDPKVYVADTFSSKVHYNYSTDWLDQLTSTQTIMYDKNGDIDTTTTAQSFIYDDQGNPTTITNFMYDGTEYDHATLQYAGRQLESIYIFSTDPQSEPDVVISYTYNDQGYRTSKSVWTWASQSTITTEYHLQGDKVLLESDGTYAIIYTYDYDGKLISFNYDSNKNDTTKGIEYYYIRNQQGDITKIVDKDGTIVVEYTYDVWGKLLKTEGSLASTIGQYNPYRYRGYRYDDEISMYYLNSRFYDPNIGRFINGDVILGPPGNTLGHNIFSYSFNNPIRNVDPSGYWSWKKFWQGTAATVAAVALVAVVVATAPVSIPTALLITGATLATGAALTYGSAAEETIVIDTSGLLATPIPGLGGKGGLSLVIDFENGSAELYAHGGGVQGLAGKFSYSVGVVENYNGQNSYGEYFMNVGGGYYLGFDHCYDPRVMHDEAVQATSLTFGVGGGGYAGLDYYQSIFYFDWGNK